MTDLTGKKIANTYKDLLQINSSASNNGVDGTARFVQDGSGTNTALKLATNRAAVNGNVSVGGALNVTGGIAAGSLNVDGFTVSALTGTEIYATNILRVGGDNVATSATLAELSSTLVSLFNSFTTSIGGIVFQAIASINTLEQQLISDVSTINTSITVIDAALVSINSQVSINRTNITEISTSLSAAIVELQLETSTINTNITNIEAAISTVELDISNNNTAIAANTSSIAVNNVAIGNNAAAIIALSATLEGRINTVSAAVPVSLSDLSNDLWETTVAIPTTSGGKPAGYLWFVVA